MQTGLHVFSPSLLCICSLLFHLTSLRTSCMSYRLMKHSCYSLCHNTIMHTQLFTLCTGCMSSLSLCCNILSCIHFLFITLYARYHCIAAVNLPSGQYTCSIVVHRPTCTLLHVCMLNILHSCSSSTLYTRRLLYISPVYMHVCL